jgi:hypothetical protein
MTTELMAGRELDAEVARVVMGWTDIVVSDIGAFGHPLILKPEWARIIVPHYSTDIGAAWEIVQRMRALGWSLVIGLNGAATNQNGAKFIRAAYLLGFSIFDGDRSDGYDAVAETASLAISLAALAATATPAGRAEGSED